MLQLEFKHDTGKIIRIDKRVARRLYNQKETIYLLSSNFAPGPWVQPFSISLQDNNAKECLDNDFSPLISQSTREFIHGQAEFDNRVNNFEYYNCSDTETGLYASFYRFVN